MLDRKSGIDRKVRPDERIPVGGHRDILKVQGLDPNYSYRWVEDENESGQRIFDFIQGGWDFANPKNLKIGQNFVYNSNNVGSVVRKPSGGKYLYLMCIPIELYEQDQKEKQNGIDALEKDMFRERDSNADDGQYGGGKKSHSF